MGDRVDVLWNGKDMLAIDRVVSSSIGLTKTGKGLMVKMASPLMMREIPLFSQYTSVVLTDVITDGNGLLINLEGPICERSSKLAT